MTWLKSWGGKRKKEKPNQLRMKPTIAFRSDLSPETLGYIKRLSNIRQKSRFINQAIEMSHFYRTSKKQFLKQMMQENYEICKYLLRKIGNDKSGR